MSFHMDMTEWETLGNRLAVLACPESARLSSSALDGLSVSAASFTLGCPRWASKSPEPRNTMKRELPLVLLAVTSAGCDLLPQNSTEWTIALSVTGVLVVGAIVAAWIGARRNKR